jgi:hypothetical protein
LPFLTGKSQDTLFGHSAGDIWYDDHDRTEPADWFRRRGYYTRSVVAADNLAHLDVRWHRRRAVRRAG